VIKLRQLISEATIACGQCLQYAWHTYMVKQSDAQANKKMKIVFGMVGSKWISGGKRYKHAWVEDKGKVKDWQTMTLGMSKYAKKGWPKKEFYKFYSPSNLKVYSAKEAADNFKKTKSMAGWDW
jgi:hypothetical protein